MYVHVYTHLWLVSLNHSTFGWKGLRFYPLPTLCATAGRLRDFSTVTRREAACQYYFLHFLARLCWPLYAYSFFSNEKKGKQKLDGSHWFNSTFKMPFIFRRLKLHYASYEPTIRVLHEKHHTLLKQKMLTSLERDRAVKQVKRPSKLPQSDF